MPRNCPRCWRAAADQLQLPACSTPDQVNPSMLLRRVLRQRASLACSYTSLSTAPGCRAVCARGQVQHKAALGGVQALRTRELATDHPSFSQRKAREAVIDPKSEQGLAL